MCCGDDVTVINLLYPTETGAPQWLFGLAGAGEKGNASLLTFPVFVVVIGAWTASLQPPLLSDDALSSLLTPHMNHFLTCFHSSFVVLLLFYITPPPPPLSLTSPWHQDRRMLERRMAELEEELKVRSHSYRGHRHFACFCSISLALACVFHINCRFHLPTNNYLKRWTQLLFYKLSDISSKTEQNALEAS